MSKLENEKQKIVDSHNKIKNMEALEVQLLDRIKNT